MVSLTIMGSNKVATDRRTEFKKLACADLRNGIKVKVRGARQADGTILANEVEKK